MKDYEACTISVNDIVHTIRECRRNVHYKHMIDHMLTFASELTGISEDTLVSLVLGEDDNTELTDEMVKELKNALFDNGVEAIDDFLGFEHDVNEEKDTIESRMDEVLDQMPEEDILKFYKKYCTQIENERIILKAEDGSYYFADDPNWREEYAEELEKGLVVGIIDMYGHVGLHESEKSALYDDMTGYIDKLQNETALDYGQRYIVTYFEYNKESGGLNQCVDFNVTVTQIIENTLKQKYVEGAYYYTMQQLQLCAGYVFDETREEEKCEKSSSTYRPIKIYCVKMSDDEIDETIGYATSEEKAKKMIEIMKSIDGFENFEYRYFYAFTDTLEINDSPVVI